MPIRIRFQQRKLAFCLLLLMPHRHRLLASAPAAKRFFNAFLWWLLSHLINEFFAYTRSEVCFPTAPQDLLPQIIVYFSAPFPFLFINVFHMFWILLRPIHYFININSFLSGATGFVGKTLLEKLLWSFAQIKCIYILIREKNGKTAEQRFHDFRAHKIFGRLRLQQPNNLSKLKFLAGNIEKENLGK